MPEILGIDVGGTGIKGAVVDTGTGELASERHRVSTPRPATPDGVAAAVKALVDEFGWAGPVGCCFPTVVVDGRALTASNLHEAWRDTRVDTTLSRATGLEFTVLNDADAAGIAEMRFGAGAGLDGLVITITIGTGLGSCVFHRGRLIPNVELGRIPGRGGKPVEYHAGKLARKREDLSWREWGERFNGFLRMVVRVFSPDDIILGGGASKKFHKFSESIDVPTPLHIATLRNNAGIVGAALAAAETARA